MKSMNLNGSWKLGICTQEVYKKLSVEPCNIQQVESNEIPIITATVPGNYEIDLEANGLIESPFFGKNPLENLDREMDHLFYSKSFDFEPDPHKDYLLRFEGIDTIADIYLNGQWIARTENMLKEHVLDIKGTAFLTGENEIPSDFMQENMIIHYSKMD